MGKTGIIRKTTVVQPGKFYRAVLAAAILAVSGCASIGQSKSSQAVPVERDPLYDGVAPITFDSLLTKDDNADFELLGDAAARTGQQDKAIYAYLRALQQGGDRAQLFSKIGALHKARGNHKLALMAYDRALKASPDNVSALLGSGLIRLALRDYSRAQSTLNRVVELDRLRVAGKENAVPDAKATSTGQVVAEDVVENPQMDGQEPTATHDELSPPTAYNGLGILADLAGDYRRAIDYYHIADAIRPNSAVTRNNLGYSHYLAGEFAAAKWYFRNAVILKPDFKRAWRNLALVYARQEHYEAALNTLTQVMSKPEANNALGYLCMLQGKHDVAERFFQEAITLSPTYYELAFQNLEKNRLLNNGKVEN